MRPLATRYKRCMAASVPHQVVIIGGGFGGLYAAQGLKRAPVRVPLVDRSCWARPYEGTETRKAMGFSPDSAGQPAARAATHCPRLQESLRGFRA